MILTTVFFDLDSTLYPESCGLWQKIRERIDLYMHERLAISQEQIPILRKGYFEKFGTTLKGLQANYAVDQQDYLDFVHDLPLEDFLSPNDNLRRMLLSIPKRRWILTNSDDAHVQRVLRQLAISDCFEGVVDIFALQPFCKPQREAFHKALEIAGATAPQDCAFLDDSADNTASATAAGFFTILVGPNDGLSHAGSADRALSNLMDLPEVAPELWQ